MDFRIGTDYDGFPALYEPIEFTLEKRFAGSLKDEVVIVTGASAKIGYAIAKAFGPLKQLVEDIRLSGGHAIAIVKNNTARAAAEALISEVEEKLGAVDVLVADAGITKLGPLVNEPDNIDLWWRVHEFNVRAPMALIRAVLPSMIDRKTGIIITISSNVVTMDLPCMAAYASSRAATSKLHESITPELQGTRVHTFAVHPGLVISQMGPPEDAFNKSAMGHPTMQTFMSQLQGTLNYQEAELHAQLCVAVVAKERAKVLSGHHLNAEQDLEGVNEEAEKENKGKIGEERLYLVNIDFL